MQTKFLIFLIFILAILCWANLSFGTIWIEPKQIISFFLRGTTEYSNIDFLIIHFRLPRILGAITAGASLAVAGVLMQTWFRNPLAEPSILGVTAGGSLGIALLTLGSGWGIWQNWNLLGNFGISVAAIFCSFLILLLLISLVWYAKNTNILLLFGILIGQLIMALIGIWQYFSHPEKVQEYLRWTMGSLEGITFVQSLILLFFNFVALFVCWFNANIFNIWYLGEDYAKSLGKNTRQHQVLIIVLVSILAGNVTAFCGPIGFVGIMVPHLTRNFIKNSQHQILLPYSALLGAILLLFCDGLGHWFQITLPLNALTSLFGIPISLWVLINLKGKF
jgi:iron complex transport system permease protein